MHKNKILKYHKKTQKAYCEWKKVTIFANYECISEMHDGIVEA